MIVDQKSSKNIVGVYLLEGTVEGSKLGLSSVPSKARRLFAKLNLGWIWMSIKELKEAESKLKITEES